MRGQNAALIQRYFPGYRPPMRVYEDLLHEQVQASTAWLDLGCGEWVCSNARLNGELPQRCRLAVGVDRDPRLSEHASFKNLVLCDAAALPLKGGTFSLVTASMVFEHLEKPQDVVNEIARITQPGGRFVVFTPNRFNYAMVVAAVTPYRLHVLYKKLTYYVAKGEWWDFSGDVFPTWYRANSVRRLRRLTQSAGFGEERLDRLPFVHSFGFVRPLYALSLLIERVIARLGLRFLQADILGVFVKKERTGRFVG